MAKKNARRSRQSDRRIWISSIRKDPPDYQKLGRAFLALAMAQAEAEAQAQDVEAKKRSDQSHDKKNTDHADSEDES